MSALDLLGVVLGFVVLAILIMLGGFGLFLISNYLVEGIYYVSDKLDECEKEKRKNNEKLG